MTENEETYLRKAEESLEGAESEFANGRYSNCANRCYYACFQAAIHALIVETEALLTTSNRPWSHSYVQAQFAGELINRRKRYPAGLRRTLVENLALRERADYAVRPASETQALRALRRSRAFVTAVRSGGERS